jgi:flagellar biosynthesis protein FlhF
MEALRRAVWQAGLSRGPGAGPGGGREVLPLLLEADLDPQLAHEIAACVEARLAGDPLLAGAGEQNQESGQQYRQRAIAEELERRFSTDPSLGNPAGQPRIAAFVGPPGVGKTSTLAKLAVRHGLAKGRSVQFLSLDAYRIAAAEPLRTYAAILGVGFEAPVTAPAFRQALREHRNKDLILVDTPGWSSRETDIAAALAGLLGEFTGIDTHLVLAATTCSADLTSAVDRFEIFRPSKLALTKLDEASTIGAAFSQAVRTGKPLSFLSGGQQVPEDLEDATKERVTGLILGRQSV